MRTEPCAQIQYVKTKGIMCKSMPMFFVYPSYCRIPTPSVSLLFKEFPHHYCAYTFDKL